MKKVYNILIFALLCVLAVNNIHTVFGASRYDFTLEINHDFDEDEEITCDVYYDDSHRTWTVDDNSDSDELELSKHFEESLKVECDKKVDEIELRVYDPEGVRVDRETYEDVKTFNYELNNVDEDEDWFEIEIDHHFTSAIDCELTVDDKKYDYTFDSDSDSDDLLIQKNYDKTIEFDCEDELDEISFKVYDDDGENTYKKTFTDKKYFNYDIDETEYPNEFILEIDHDFDSDETINCDLKVDDRDTEDLEFDKYSDSTDLKIIRDFDEEFELDCDRRFDSINLRVYNEQGEKVHDEDFEDEDDIEYTFSDGQYEFLIELFDNFEYKVRCDLRIDDDDKKRFDFDSSSSKSDLRIEDDFDGIIEFDCDEKIEKISFFVFEDDKNHNGDLLDKKEYTNVDSFYYDYSKRNNIIEDQNETDETNTVDNTSSTTTTTTNNDSETTNNQIETSSSNTTGVDNLNNNGQNTNSTNISGTQTSNNTVNVQVSDNNESSLDSSFVKVLFVLFLVVLIFTAIVVASVKLGSIKKHNKIKKRSQQKSNVDFDFLNKKR